MGSLTACCCAAKTQASRAQIVEKERDGDKERENQRRGQWIWSGDSRL
jgi:hypothetical protein